LKILAASRRPPVLPSLLKPVSTEILVHPGREFNPNQVSHDEVLMANDK
jgi:ribosomal protein S19